MFFSICMPVYNAESYLNDALESVRSQVFPSFEVILVIDTKTSDQSRSVVAEFRRKATNLRIKVLETGFSNVNANRNALIRASEGRYILFFDADDLLPPYCLATLYQVICDHPETTLLLTEKIDFSDAATVVFGAMPEPLQVRSHSSLFHAQKEHYWTSTAALCVRRDEALKFRFDDALEVHGDLDFFLQCGALPHFIKVMSPVLLGYRHHESQLSMPKIGSRHQESTRSCLYIQEKERLGQYGLSQWDRYRRYMIARLFRAISIGALHRGEWGDAFLLYFKSFFWNVLAMRWQYVLGFWFVFLQSGILRHGLRYTGIRK